MKRKSKVAALTQQPKQMFELILALYPKQLVFVKILKRADH